MKVTVKFFAGIAEATGKRMHELVFNENPTINDIVNQLIVEFPAATDIIKKSMVSLNHDYAEPDQEVSE